VNDTHVIPGTGVVVALDADPQELAEAWDQLITLEADLRTTKREISDEITRRLDYQGRRSLEIDGVRFETTAPTEKEWNLKELQDTLGELRQEGTISAEKARRCIAWTPKAVWSEIRTLLSDPRCKARLEHCYTEVPAARYAKVKRA
jgi:hypothetical protein